MTPKQPNLRPEALRARAAAGVRLHERRHRARRIRQRVGGVTVALFFFFWAVIGVQLASGHDPALTRDARRQAQYDFEARLAAEQEAAAAATATARSATLLPTAPKTAGAAQQTTPTQQPSSNATPSATSPSPSAAQAAPSPTPVITRPS
jgi:uncharacterized iron-regulated membrane protein